MNSSAAFPLSIVLAATVLISCVVWQRDPGPRATSSLWTEAERQFLIEGLGRTGDLLARETAGLSEAQWHFKAAPDRWSIAEIVEHLGVQEDLYFREVYLIAQMPELPAFRAQVEGQDAHILAYATAQEPGSAARYLQPLGRWNSRTQAVGQFLSSRAALAAFVRDTQADLRLHFTFRDDAHPLWRVRDLHQLLLTTIAHTERHVDQIRRVKAHPAYPDR